MAISVSSDIIFLGEMTASSPAIELVALELLTTGISQLVALPPEGHPVPFAWDAVPSATGAEVDAAGLRIAPIATQKAIGEVKVEEKSGHHVVTTGNRRIRTLKLNGLKYLPDGSDPVPIGSSAQLPANFRLVVTVPDGNGDWLPPLHSVPPVPGQGMLPQSLTGASFEDGLLQLPDLAAPKIRITLAEGSFPEDFQPRTMELDSVEATETIVPKDLEVLSPDGSPAWAFPGEFPPQGPPVEVDLRLPVQNAFSAACTAGQPPGAVFTIKGTGTIGLGITWPRGALVRSFPGVIRTVLEGDPLPIELGGSLPDEKPSSVVGDLTVTYDEIRVVEHLSDKVPTQVGGLSGIIVSAEGAVRLFPPKAFEGLKVARVGIVGRSPVETELEIRFVEAASGKPLGPPAALKISPTLQVKSHWVVVPEHPPLSVPVSLAVKATKGRFYWAAGPHPLVRIAIFDPAYPGRELQMNGTPLQFSAAPSGTTHLPGWAAPREPFRNAPPILESNLFLTVDFSDPVLRYAR